MLKLKGIEKGHKDAIKEKKCIRLSSGKKRACIISMRCLNNVNCIISHAFKKRNFIKLLRIKRIYQ